MNSDNVKWFEIFAVIATAILKFIFIDWLNLRAAYIVLICLFWISYIFFKYKGDPSVLAHWGIRKTNFRKSFLFLLPLAIVCIIGIGIYGYFLHTFVLSWHILPIFTLYPLWGLIQQFIMVGLISGNLKSIQNPRFTDFQIILITSLLFSLVHYPIGSLMFFTFVMQWIFTTAFLRWRNIWPLGLFHGWIATFLLFYVLERDLWAELMVGF